jgi:hypothetical protein
LWKLIEGTTTATQFWVIVWPSVAGALVAIRARVEGLSVAVGATLVVAVIAGVLFIVLKISEVRRRQAAATKTGDSDLRDALRRREQELDDAQQRAVEWQQKYLDLERTREGQSRELNREIEKANNQLAEARESVTRLSWQVRYAEEYPQFPALSEADLRTVSPHVDQCVHAAVKAGNKIVSVLEGLLQHVDRRGHPSAEHLLVLFAAEQVLVPLQRVTGLLQEPTADPRAALVTFYARYHSARHWLERATECIQADQGHPINQQPVDLRGREVLLFRSIAGFTEWWSADVKFAEEIAKIRTIRLLSHLGSAIAELNDWHLYPSPLRSTMDPRNWGAS